MENATIPSLLFLVPVAAVTILLNRIWRSRVRRRLPPGPWGVTVLCSLPFADPELHRYFADIARKYGPVASLRLGSRLFVLVSSSSAATEVLKVHDSVLSNRDVPLVARIFNSEEIVWTPYGPVWRMLRKVAVKELLHTAVINSFESLRRRVVHGMIAELRSKVGTEVIIRAALYSATLDQMLGMVWKDALSEEHNLSQMKRELLEVTGGVIELLGAPNISDFFPLLAPLDLQGMQGKMGKLTARFDAIMDSIMKQRVPSGTAAAREGGVHDFIQLLVDLIDRRDPDMPLQSIHAKGIVFNIIAGGTDTVSTAVEWVLSELMCHPEITAKVMEELDSVVGRGCVLEESHIPKLEYLDAVVKETLRLHPVLPILIPHAPNRTCEVGGYTIPEGATVIVNAWAIQRDPSVWEEPLEFRPERFLERRDELEYIGKSFEYCPFGGGRRICVGMNLAERMMMYLVGSLLQSLEWQLPHGATTIDLQEKFGTVTRLKEPLVLVPVTRKIGSTPPEC